MKRIYKSKKIVGPLKILAVLSVGLATMRSAQAETTIIFDGAGLVDNKDMPQSYGDFASTSGNGINVNAGLDVVGTPNIGLTWGPGTGDVVDWYASWDGRGSVAQLDYNINSGAPISITFTPDSAYGVLLNSFDMDEWAGGGSMSVDWSVSDANGILASGNWARSTGGRDTIFTGLTAADINVGQPVELTFTGLSGQGSYFAIDNLTFDQVQAVPEPTTLALMALGLGAVVIRCRRK
jgi:hypothetical protein